ncbi:helix-turn-helix transcriptional regulator [Candidatus Methylacidiphilum infernorum]|uniref:Transcriptional regulator containing HTH domain, ArsR n=2 Tax=Candidatus Methylacidiphilum infernorum TaxID=511746 RepID=B3DWD4_METI4|nr:metalloregulator ArsR/SmtB family transcription factor [Candidatus Methylacidiphilum infernorum]ACD83637.1 Transcriptional regulator containing HTH domain, ArsR [Methylacidiphilum infernorum V4]QSR87152.1 helix-turn-helix transcriptional regulator [Candidatus Methylacidiphilum infernorum]
MDTSTALSILSALAQKTRIEIFKLLIKKGPSGCCPGEIAEKLGIPLTTLSFHLHHLKSSTLIEATQQGRQILYRADFAKIAELIGYLLEDCCGKDLQSLIPFFCKGSEEKELQKTKTDE